MVKKSEITFHKNLGTSAKKNCDIEIAFHQKQSFEKSEFTIFFVLLMLLDLPLIAAQ